MTPLDKFGQFVIHNLRDRAIGHHRKLQAGEWRGPAMQELQAAVVALPADTQRLVMQCVAQAIDTATHDLLYALQDAHDHKLGLEVLVDGASVAGASDGLQGEPYGERGWIRRYSRYADTHRPA